jgi:hypothetical protein
MIRFDSHDQFVEMDAGLIGVYDRFIHRNLVAVIIEQGVERVLRARI